MSAKWAILVIYEGAAAREPAMRFCDGLVQKFWPEFSFELSWLDWGDLEDATAAKAAQHKAAEAQLLVVAAASAKMIPGHVQRWIECSIRNRGDREGVLVGLTGDGRDASAAQMYLRKLAHQGGMDYLTAIPHNLPHAVPDSAESYNVRATQMTSVLGAILNRVPSPPRLL
jgi:hypothetical protein